MGYPTQEAANRFGHQASGVAAANPPRMTIASALGNLDAVLKRTLDYTQRLEVIADHICGGAQLNQTGPDNTAPIPTHLLSQIEARCDLLATAMNRVEKALVTIEEVL